MKTQTTDPHAQSVVIQPGVIFRARSHENSRGGAWLRLAVVCAIAITLAGALSAQTAITYTFNGTCSGSVDGTTFVNASFTITLAVADLTTIYNSGGSTFSTFSTLGVAGATIQLSGFGLATFSDSWQVSDIQAGSLIRFSSNGSYLEGTNPAFYTYNLQSPIGPDELTNLSAQFNGIHVKFRGAIVDAVLSIQESPFATFSAFEAQPVNGDCTQAIITCAFPQAITSSGSGVVPHSVSNGQCSNLPAGATNITDGYTNSNDGELSVLYPGVDTSLNNWYTPATMPCPSIGGTLPPIVQPTISGVVNPGAANSLAGTLAAMLPNPRHVPLPYPTMPGPYNPAEATVYSCLAATEGIVRFCDQLAQSPFHGKDVIYVHGLFEDVIQHVAEGNAKAVPPGCPATSTGFPEWPSCPAAFTTPNGYFRYGASQYWNDTSDPTQSHIQNYLINQLPSSFGAGIPRNPPAMNRYITVGWSSAQSLEIGANAVLYQIADAMVNGEGVTFLPGVTDPRGTHGFCVDGCIIISHSTGGPITDVAMNYANDPLYFSTNYNASNPAFIPQHVSVHVALAGAFSGSQLATTVMIAAYALTQDVDLCTLAGLVLFDGTPPFYLCGADLTALQNTVLLDLVPQITQKYWYSSIVNTPVPVLTVAGASDWLYYPEKYFILRGFDDGVVTMDSACARDGMAVPVGEWPSGFGSAGLNVGDPRLYDIGANFNFSTGGPTFNFDDDVNCNNPVESKKIFGVTISDACGSFKADRYFLEQNYEFLFSAFPFDVIPRAAAACAPLKTPWGMIEPTVPYSSLPIFDPTTYYKNHYSFLQTAEDHYGLLKGTDPGRPDTSAVLDSTVYNTPHYCFGAPASCASAVYTTGLGLVSTAFKQAQHQVTRGFYKSLPFTSIKWWVWKRTYHFLTNWENMGAADYVYKYVN